MGSLHLSTDDVIAIATRCFGELGYAAPILRGDTGRALLDMAVVRAENVGYYSGGDLIAQATAMGNGIAHNHAFVDGNKRSALAALLVFLRINGRPLPPDQIVPLARVLIHLQQIEDRAAADPLLEAWLRERLGNE